MGDFCMGLILLKLCVGLWLWTFIHAGPKACSVCNMVDGCISGVSV